MKKVKKMKANRKIEFYPTGDMVVPYCPKCDEPTYSEPKCPFCGQELYMKGNYIEKLKSIMGMVDFKMKDKER